MARRRQLPPLRTLHTPLLTRGRPAATHPTPSSPTSSKHLTAAASGRAAQTAALDTRHAKVRVADGRSLHDRFTSEAIAAGHKPREILKAAVPSRLQHRRHQVRISPHGSESSLVRVADPCRSIHVWSRGIARSRLDPQTLANTGRIKRADGPSSTTQVRRVVRSSTDANSWS
jgi:hypothetical protein